MTRMAAVHASVSNVVAVLHVVRLMSTRLMSVRHIFMNNAVAADIHTALVTASTPLDLASIVAGIAAADSVSTSTVDFANHAVADCQMLSNSA